MPMGYQHWSPPAARRAHWTAYAAARARCAWAPAPRDRAVWHRADPHSPDLRETAFEAMVRPGGRARPLPTVECETAVAEAVAAAGEAAAAAEVEMGGGVWHVQRAGPIVSRGGEDVHATPLDSTALTSDLA
jgi:hypothetical protein